MIREKLMEKSKQTVKDIRWRGGEISRLEGFSDAVFAFALTLLVVSLVVPKTFDELLLTMRGFIAFSICFAILSQVWYNHYIFFRRYALQNTYIIFLNTILLFVVLFYVYPLKFLFGLIVNELLSLLTGIDSGVGAAIQEGQIPQLLIIYGLGWIAVFSVFALLYHHAYRKRHELELTELETFITWGAAIDHLSVAAIGLLSVLLSLTGTSPWVNLAGWVYMLIPVVKTITGTWIGRQKKIIERRQAVHPSTPPAKS